MVAAVYSKLKINVMAKYAKRKKSKKATPRRRRRIGAMAMNASNPLIQYGPIAAGFFLAAKINDPLIKAIGDKVDKKIVAAGEAGLGAFLVFGKGKKSIVKSVVGGVALGAGIKLLMQSFGIGGVGPYGRTPVIGGAYGNVQVLGGRRRVGVGYTPNNSMNGYTPNRSLASRIMGGVGKGSGSGITNTSGGEMMA